MEQVTRQLEHVRTVGRWMLIAQRLCQWVAAVIALAMVLGLIDFLLRLPGWFRLIVGVSAAAVAGTWLIGRLWRAASFRPALGQLALRAERMYPQVAGTLASAVEFTTDAAAAAAARPARTAALVDATVREAARRLGDMPLNRLIDPTRTGRRVLIAAVALLALLCVALVDPGTTRIAAARWLAPLGDAQWPRRTHIVSTVDERVWPIDTPIRLRAEIDRGYGPAMRVRAFYRIVDARGEPGPWRQELMNEQTAPARADAEPDKPDQPQEVGVFERLIDPPAVLSRLVEQDPGGRAVVEYYFEAGDDQTKPASMTVVQRPAVRAVTAEITPPAYAAALVGTQRAALHEQTTQVVTASALHGSRINLELRFNKPLPISRVADAAVITPGIAELEGLEVTPLDASGNDTAQGVALQWTLRDSVDTAIHLSDEFGLSNHAERTYRFEAVEDELPTASLTEPPADQTVLATAVVDIEGVAHDEVGLERLTLEADVPIRTLAETGEAGTRTIELAEQVGRQRTATATARLDLEPHELEPGQTVLLFATALDAFDMDGLRHAPVRSPPRRLRIIDELTLISQIRSELAAVRQQAIRLEQTQRRAMELEPDPASGQQTQVSQRLRRQGELIERLQQRMASNRLEEMSLEQMLSQSAGLIEQATRSSDAATRQLEQDDADAAHQLQDQIVSTLQELIELLDQGRDALTLQLQLSQLRTELNQVAQDVRRVLPQTVGQEKQDLPAHLAESLDELARRQEALAEQSDALVRQMQSTADVLARQGQTDRERAAAESLAEAAAIAQRQGLRQEMQQASQSVDQNQLAQAGREQARAGDIIDQMLDEMGSTQQRMQEMLRRRLQQLTEAIQKLIERQKLQIDALVKAERTPPLEPPQSALRRNTMSVEQQARAAEQTQAVADAINEAVADQADAVVALRGDERDPAHDAEGAAVADLESALELVNQLNEQAQAEQAQEQRDELRKAYEALAQRQDELRDGTAELVDASPLTRKQRGQLRTLGHEQADLQIEAADLGEKVDQTLIFKALHRRMDESAARIVSQLRGQQADAGTVIDQEQIATMLRTMAEALRQTREDDQFAGRSPDGGGGAGGGAGGGQAAMIPPLAELKLLRGMQQAIHDTTRRLDEAGVDTASDADRDRLLELSTQQRELGTLGELLIEQLQGGAE